MYSTLYSLAKRVTPPWIFNRVVGRWNAHGLKRYASNTGWALGARLFNSVTSFFVTIYLVRYLGPEHYGNLSYAISFVGLFGIIATLGIDNILYRDLVKYPEKRNEYLGTALAIRLTAGLVASFAAAVSGFLTSPDDVARLVILLLAGTFVFSSFNIITNEFKANVEQKYPSVVTMLVVFTLNLLKLAVIFSNQGILYIGAILLLEPILYAIFFSYIRVHHYGSLRNWRFSSAVARSLLYDAWPFIFISVFMAVYSRIDQIMLKHLIDSTAVGIYDAALRLAEAWLFVPAIIGSSLFPAIVNAKKINIHEYKTRLLTLVGVFVIMAVLIAMPLSLLAKQIIQLFYGSPFSGSAPVFAIYIWVSVWAVVDIVMRNFLVVENMRKTIFFMTVGTAILNTVLNFMLIPLWGPTGAAWSTFISYSFFTLPLILVLRIRGKDDNLDETELSI